MLIHVNRHYFARGKTGKGKFTRRLVNAWSELGVAVTDDPEVNADIALHIGRMNYKSKARRNVLRVGPACIDTNMNWRKINKEKEKSVKKADAIVYQSRYSKKIYRKLVCKPDKPETVILNGADPRAYCRPVLEGWLKPGFKHIFLASTRIWLKQKRLRQLVDAFSDPFLSNSLLVVCGDALGLDKRRKDLKNILFAGNVSDEGLSFYFSRSAAMIHTTWVDACPNSIVEAQVAGCPVICTNQGGSREVLKFGKIINDTTFGYKPVDLNHPPALDRESLLAAIDDLIHIRFGLRKDSAKELYIVNIAKQYLAFFESLL